MNNMMDILFEIHKDMPRQGPGSDASTQRALSLLKNIPQAPKILDVGCGPGAQTIKLAQLTDASISALDFHQPYLDELMQKAQEENVSERITTVHQDMAEMSFDSSSFDIIWSEGAIYNIGFEQGVKEWRPFLRDGGYLAVTEISWLTDSPPREIFDFWNREYPGMRTKEQNEAILRKEAYQIIGSFVLPESDWWDTYYKPLEERLSILQEKHSGEPEFLEQIALEREEMELYKKYSHSYGYIFYLAKKQEEGP